MKTKKIFMISAFVLIFILIFSATMPAVLASDEDTAEADPFIADLAQLLTDGQLNELEQKAARISAQYQCEVRLITVDDMANWEFSDIADFAEYIYTESNYGIGADRSCVLLLLSMAERDYDFRAWGDTGRTAFTFYGIDTILDRHILPELGNNNFYEAFSKYFDKSEEYLKMARDGEPISPDNDPDAENYFIAKLIATILIPLVIAGIVCSNWKSKMKTAKTARTANNYIPENGFKLIAQEDKFLYRTTTRRKIEKSSSSSSGASSRGSSSGRSGKF